MTPSRLRKMLRSIALGALVGFGACGAAHAALVVGVFDPDFGGTLEGTNYSGTATFSISQSCLDLNLPSTGAFIPFFAPCGSASSGMGFLGAHVDFAPTADPSDPAGRTGDVDFLADPNAILGMYVRDHHVIGVWSKAMGPRLADLDGANDPSFFIEFGPLFPPGSNFFNMLYGDLLAHDLDSIISALQTTTLYLVNADGCKPGQPGCEASNAATTTYVPEPGSMSLALAALGAGWLVRRRKRGAVIARPA
jgi:uncharacterized protein (TIGR03382 family)